MKIANQIIELQTKKELDFIDVTENVIDFVQKSEIKNGLVNIQTLHTTALLFLNENEPLLLEDFRDYLKRLAPKSFNYQHNDFTRRTINICENECENGHSHCLALNLPTNLTLNLIDGKLQLGQWQRIFAIELDKPRPRKIQVQIIGE